MSVDDIASAAYRRIMVGVDGSADAATALGHALRIAQAFDSELYVVHILDATAPDAFELDDTGAERRPYEERKADAEEILDAQIGRIPDVSKLKLHARLEEGEPSERLLALSGELDVDLLVLGAKGLSGFKRFMLGSVSYAVTRQATRPVLVIHG